VKREKLSKTLQVSIEKLSFKTIIGILPEERITPQSVILDIVFEYKYKDNTKKFIDYSKVAELAKNTMIEKKFELIEEALLTLEELLYKTYPLKNLQIKISKPDILDDCIVSVSSLN